MKKFLKMAVVALTAVLTVTGCSSGLKSQATQALAETLDAFKTGDAEIVEEYYSFDRVTAFMDDAQAEKFRQGVLSALKEMTYEIKAEEKVNDSAVNLRVAVTTIDIEEVVEDYIEEVRELVNSADYQRQIATMTEEQYNNLMAELMNRCIADNRDEKETRVVTVTMVKGQSGNWSIGGNSEELIGALFADISDAVDDLI